MAIPIRRQTATSVGHLKWLITDDGSRTLWDSSLDETYHSGCGAISESLHVYLLNSGVAELLTLEPERRIGVLEFGFGTATNFILTAAFAECANASLEYSALENNLLPPTLFADLEFEGSLANTPVASVIEPTKFRACAATLQNWLVEQLTNHPPKNSEWSEYHFSDRIQLRLFLGDALANDWVSDETSQAMHFDAIYFDPFSPETNPQLWTDAVFSRALAILKPTGTLTSYCVKSSVRRALASTGFEVSKTKGPEGGKREVLVAIRPNPT